MLVSFVLELVLVVLCGIDVGDVDGCVYYSGRFRCQVGRLSKRERGKKNKYIYILRRDAISIH